jgi:DNA gyrase subunit A
VVGSFPVEDSDEIMLVTDGGQTIRMPVGGEKPIRIAGRSTQGVTLFATQGEHVVSVERLSEADADKNGDSNGSGSGETTGNGEDAG